MFDSNTINGAEWGLMIIDEGNVVDNTMSLISSKSIKKTKIRQKLDKIYTISDKNKTKIRPKLDKTNKT